jgi:hypothetical protein
MIGVSESIRKTTRRALKFSYRECTGSTSIKFKKEDLENASSHCYGEIEEIVNKADLAIEGRIMKITENIYIYKQNNNLNDKQETYEENHMNIFFDTAKTHADNSTHPDNCNVPN